MSGKQITLSIQGMTCASCVAHVERALKGVQGVADANVNLATERASVWLSTDAIEMKELVKAVESAGYSAMGEREKATFKVGGMTCASCAQTIEKALNKVEGVFEASVNLATERATIAFDAGVTNIRALEQVVEGIGYTLGLIETGESVADVEKEVREKEIRTLKRRFIWAALFAFPILYVAMVELISKSLLPGFLRPEHFPVRFALFQVIFSIPVIIVGRDFYRIGFPKLFKGSPNMDSLIGMGTAAAYLYSFYAAGLVLLDKEPQRAICKEPLF